MLCVGWGDVAGADKGVPKTCVRVNRCGGAFSGRRQGGVVSLRPSRCALLGRALPSSPSWGCKRAAWLEGEAWPSPVLRCHSDKAPVLPRALPPYSGETGLLGCADPEWRGLSLGAGEAFRATWDPWGAPAFPTVGWSLKTLSS